MFSGAKVDTISNHFCAATVDGFCCSAKGNVTSCTEVFSESSPFASRFFYGRAAAAVDGYEFDSEVLSSLRDLGVENRRFCKDCFAKWHCAGDCLHKALNASTSDELGGAGRCQTIRELTKDLLLERIAESGGFLWVRGAHSFSQAPSMCSIDEAGA